MVQYGNKETGAMKILIRREPCCLFVFSKRPGKERERKRKCTSNQTRTCLMTQNGRKRKIYMCFVNMQQHKKDFRRIVTWVFLKKSIRTSVSI